MASAIRFLGRMRLIEDMKYWFSMYMKCFAFLMAYRYALYILCSGSVIPTDHPDADLFYFLK